MVAMSQQMETVGMAEYNVRNTFVHYNTSEFDDQVDNDPTPIMVGKTKSNILDGTPVSSHAQSDTTLGDMSVVSMPESCPPAPMTNVLAAHYTVRNTFIHYDYDTCDSDDEEDEDPTAIMMGKTKSNILDGTRSWRLGDESPVSKSPMFPMNDVLAAKLADVDYKVKNTFIHYDNSDLDSEDDEDPTEMVVGKSKSNFLDGKLMSPKKRCVIDIVATLVDDLPSVGSAGHALGKCKPCAWYWKPGSCVNGSECGHCHTCDADALKRRKKNRAERLRKTSKTDA